MGSEQVNSGFEWDEEKHRINVEKHGVGFELAQTVFEDPNLLLRQDRMVDGEERWQALGTSLGGVLLLVAHTVHMGDDDEESIRIISARRAARQERADYRAFQTKGGRTSF